MGKIKENILAARVYRSLCSCRFGVEKWQGLRIDGAVTAAARLNLDSLYQSSPLMVINDAINRPAELGVGAAFIKVESWKVDGGAEPGSLRTRQVVSGYGSLGSESGRFLPGCGTVRNGLDGLRTGQKRRRR